MDATHITRRNVLSGFPLAALAVSLPAVAAADGTDAELVALGQALAASMAEEICTQSAFPADPGAVVLPAVVSAFDVAWEVSNAIVKQIEPLPARSVAGLRVKALAAHWCGRWDGTNPNGGDPADPFAGEAEPPTDQRLFAQIVDGLLGWEG